MLVKLSRHDTNKDGLNFLNLSLHNSTLISSILPIWSTTKTLKQEMQLTKIKKKNF